MHLCSLHFAVIWELFPFTSRTQDQKTRELDCAFYSRPWEMKREHNNHRATLKLPILYSGETAEFGFHWIIINTVLNSNDWTQFYRSQCTFNVFFLKKQKNKKKKNKISTEYINIKKLGLPSECLQKQQYIQELPVEERPVACLVSAQSCNQL